MHRPIRNGVCLLRCLTSAVSRLPCQQQTPPKVISRSIHCTAPVLSNAKQFQKKMDEKNYKWVKYNDIVYPPQKEGEPRRPAEICHMRPQIKYSPQKMWYLAMMIRGMTIDEAIKQMTFNKHKGAKYIKEVLLEAQEIAVRDHNVEFKSNLWVESSFVGRGMILKSFRKHKVPNYGTIHYRYVHYFVRLREGRPPEHYYPPEQNGYQKMEEYIKEQRQRRIIHGQ